MDMKEYYKNCLDQSFAVAMFDIDDFKKINDKFGYDIGDIVIQKLSSFLMGWVTYGNIGVKVWIFKGEVLQKGIQADKNEDTSPKKPRRARRGK
ncbi:diguanylate cyclase, partial [Campylobacter fetus]|uniref:diguanylate cyclase n=1 Tax=Campylobacter fetus TaxID=196 RepID=UPI0019680D0E